jgi:cyclin-dependent kinase regulatory subunit CKS1
MPRFPEDIIYSDKYCDEDFEYRNVILTKEIFKKMPRKKLLSENEWRSLGV